MGRALLRYSRTSAPSQLSASAEHPSNFGSTNPVHSHWNASRPFYGDTNCDWGIVDGYTRSDDSPQAAQSNGFRVPEQWPVERADAHAVYAGGRTRD